MRARIFLPALVSVCCLGCLEVEVTRTVDNEGNCKSLFVAKCKDKELLAGILEEVPGKAQGVTFASEPVSKLLADAAEVSFSGELKQSGEHQVKYVRSKVVLTKKNDGSLVYEETLANVMMLNLLEAPNAEKKEFWSAAIERERKRTEGLVATWTVVLPFKPYETNAAEVKENRCVWRLSAKDLLDKEKPTITLKAITLPAAKPVAVAGATELPTKPGAEKPVAVATAEEKAQPAVKEGAETKAAGEPEAKAEPAEKTEARPTVGEKAPEAEATTEEPAEKPEVEAGKAEGKPAEAKAAKATDEKRKPEEPEAKTAEVAAEKPEAEAPDAKTTEAKEAKAEKKAPEAEATTEEPAEKPEVEGKTAEAKTTEAPEAKPEKKPEEPEAKPAEAQAEKPEAKAPEAEPVEAKEAKPEKLEGKEVAQAGEKEEEATEKAEGEKKKEEGGAKEEGEKKEEGAGKAEGEKEEEGAEKAEGEEKEEGAEKAEGEKKEEGAEKAEAGKKEPPKIEEPEKEEPELPPPVHDAKFNAVVELLKQLRDMDEEKRTAAQRKFENPDEMKKMVDILVKVVLDKTSPDQVRAAAAEVLGKSGDPTAVEPLIRAAKLRDPKTKKQAILALKNFPETSDRIVPVIRKALSDADISVQMAAATALAALKDKESARDIARLLNSESEQVREAAAESLGNLGETAVVPNLAKALSDKEVPVCRAAAIALGKLKDKSALRPLAEALSNEAIQSRVAEAMTEICGEDFGTDQAKWLEWIKENEIPEVAAVTEEPTKVAPTEVKEEKPEEGKEVKPAETKEEKPEEGKEEKPEEEVKPKPPQPPIEEKPRQEVMDHFNRGLSFFTEKKYDKAAEEFGKAVELKPNFDEAVKLRDQAFSMNLLVDMLASEKAEIRAAAEKILRLSEEARKRRITDPKQIAELIDGLDKGLQESWLASAELIRAGEYAVPALVAQFDVDEAHRSRRTWAVIILIKIGRPAALPLAETLRSNSPLVQQLACYCLKDIADPIAAPALKKLVQSPDTHPTVKKEALRALAKIGTPETVTAEELYVNLAQKFFTGDESIAVKRVYPPLLWRWDSEKQRLTFREVPESVYNLAMAQELARNALEASESYEPAVPLFICGRYAEYSLVSRVLETQKDLPETEGTNLRKIQSELSDVDLIALQAGKKYLYAALDTALKLDLPESAVAILKVIEQVGEASDLLPPAPEEKKSGKSLLERMFGSTGQKPVSKADYTCRWQMSPEESRPVRVTEPPKSPPKFEQKPAPPPVEKPLKPLVSTIAYDSGSVLRALESRYKLVRYAAARVLLKLSGNRPFKGMEKVPVALADALTEATTKTILMVNNDLQTTNEIRTILTDAGYALVAAASGAEGSKEFLNFPPKDFVIISDTLRDRDPEEYVKQFKESVKSQGIQIAVVTSKPAFENADVVISKPIDKPALLAIAKKAVDQRPAMSQEIVDKYALDVLDALLGIEGRDCVLDLKPVAEALMKSAELHASLPGYDLKVVRALGKIGRKEAIEFLMKVYAGPNASKELKLSAVESIGECSLPAPSETVVKFLQDVLKSDDADIRKAAATVLGRAKH